MATRQRRDPGTVMAMVVGATLGFALLAMLRPGYAPAPPAAESEVLRTPIPRVSRPVPPKRTPRRAPPAREEVSRSLPSTRPEEATSEGEVPLFATVVVDVVDPDGRPIEGATVVPVECPGFTKLEPGRFQVAPGSCSVQAVRRDGLLFARSQSRAVQLQAGDDEYLQLELRHARTGGIGVQFRPTDVGMHVISVVPDSAAWEVGLEPGDLIVEIDGESIAGFGAEEIVNAMTGAEGTDVEFTVEYPSENGFDEETLRVTRRFIEG